MKETPAVFDKTLKEHMDCFKTLDGLRGPINEAANTILSALMTGKKTSSPFLKAELSKFSGEGQSQFDRIMPPKGDFDDADEGYFSAIQSDFQSGAFDLKKAVIYSAILDAPYIDYK